MCQHTYLILYIIVLVILFFIIITSGLGGNLIEEGKTCVKTHTTLSRRYHSTLCNFGGCWFVNKLVYLERH